MFFLRIAIGTLFNLFVFLHLLIGDSNPAYLCQMFSFKKNKVFIYSLIISCKCILILFFLPSNSFQIFTPPQKHILFYFFFLKNKNNMKNMEFSLCWLPALWHGACPVVMHSVSLQWRKLALAHPAVVKCQQFFGSYFRVRLPAHLPSSSWDLYGLNFCSLCCQGVLYGFLSTRHMLELSERRGPQLKTVSIRLGCRQDPRTFS